MFGKQLVLAGFVLMTINLCPWLPASADYQNPSYDRGVSQMQSREYDGAINSFTEAIGLSMVDPKLYLLRGQCFYNVKNYQKAIADFDHALLLKPKYVGALLWKGTAQSKAGEKKQATNTYLKAMHLNPKVAMHFQGRVGVDGFAINLKREGCLAPYQDAVKLYSDEANTVDKSSM